ncbi:MAG: hypothetical protein M1816_005940 [Peltula sp. TS41687]|nr:MAG: hypothetical protein M1816_005940 [Peltula sp. TS41687]
MTDLTKGTTSEKEWEAVQEGTVQNPVYTLRSGEECGRKAAKAYKEMAGNHELGLDDQRFSKKDCDRFKGLLGVAAKPAQTMTLDGRAPIPVTYVQVQFVNQDEQVWLTRTTLRKILGKLHEDGEIQKWYQSRDITPPEDLGPTRAITFGGAPPRNARYLIGAQSNSLPLRELINLLHASNDKGTNQVLPPKNHVNPPPLEVHNAPNDKPQGSINNAQQEATPSDKEKALQEAL